MYEGEDRRDHTLELTPTEIMEIRLIIESDKRAKWLWSTLRNIAVWVVAVITGITVGYQALIDVVKGLASK